MPAPGRIVRCAAPSSPRRALSPSRVSARRRLRPRRAALDRRRPADHAVYLLQGHRVPARSRDEVHHLDRVRPRRGDRQRADGRQRAGRSSACRSGNVLAVKPLIDEARTNMTVYTSQNTYTFELRPSRSRRLLDPQLPDRFSIPRTRAGQGGEPTDRPGAAARPELLRGGPEGRFRPVAVYDDGRRTTFEFPADEPRPAIFRVDEQGRESIINVRETETGAVVTGTSDRLDAAHRRRGSSPTSGSSRPCPAGEARRRCAPATSPPRLRPPPPSPASRNDRARPGGARPPRADQPARDAARPRPRTEDRRRHPHRHPAGGRRALGLRPAAGAVAVRLRDLASTGHAAARRPSPPGSRPRCPAAKASTRAAQYRAAGAAAEGRRG